MPNPGSEHSHYCICCWNLYECACDAPFAPDSYRCAACSKIQNDAGFIRAIGVRWTDLYLDLQD